MGFDDLLNKIGGATTIVKPHKVTRVLKAIDSKGNLRGFLKCLECNRAWIHSKPEADEACIP